MSLVFQVLDPILSIGIFIDVQRLLFDLGRKAWGRRKAVFSIFDHYGVDEVLMKMFSVLTHPERVRYIVSYGGCGGL